MTRPSDPISGDPRASSGHPCTIGVDVGGSKILAGRVAVGSGAVTGVVQRDTPDRRCDAVVLEDAVVEAVRSAASGRDVAAVGLAAAGFVDGPGERVRFAPHLVWRDAEVRSRLQERLQAPVVLDNDATCAALAESRYGAGRGARSMLMVTLGTGIGGGLVIDGVPWRGANGMAGEFGHMRVVPDGAACECGLRGCWEQYCSGNALVRFARDQVGRRPSVLEEASAGNPHLITGPMVTRAAEEGDLVALDAFSAVGDWLGVGLANLVAAFDPELVVVGGGVSDAGERLLEPARRSLVRTLVGADHRDLPVVVGARLGPAAGLVGAAAMAADAVTTS